MKISKANRTKTIFLAAWAAAALIVLMLQFKQHPVAAAAAGPAEIYANNCARCHGGDGRARTSLGKRKGATDFTSDWNRDEARGVRIITNGKGEMPSFKKKLTPAEIRSVFGYVARFR